MLLIFFGLIIGALFDNAPHTLLILYSAHFHQMFDFHDLSLLNKLIKNMNTHRN